MNKIKIQIGQLKESILNLQDQENYLSITFRAHTSVKYLYVIHLLGKLHLFPNLKIGLPIGN